MTALQATRMGSDLGENMKFRESIPAPIRAVTLFIAAVALSTAAYANHPVLVEGNCDSPVPGTTLVTPGACGDFDGDGRIGTAEDTDGADRIFGTINAALGPGTGAAAGTGANMNGSVTIVTSGRFAELVVISDQTTPTSPTSLVLEAAPGVNAMIDAVLQGDPAGGNTTRQAGVGVTINATASDDRVVLRNLVIRNWFEGVRVTSGARVTIENCRFEHNVDYAIRVQGSSRAAVYDTQINDTGFRISGAASVPSAVTGGTGIFFEGSSAGVVAKSAIFGSFRNGMLNSSSGGTGAVRYYEVVVNGNGTGGVVNAVRDVY
jgi:hypothetical protein